MYPPFPGEGELAVFNTASASAVGQILVKAPRIPSHDSGDP